MLFSPFLGGNGNTVTHWNEGEQNIQELKGQSGAEIYALAIQWCCCDTLAIWRLGFRGFDVLDLKGLHFLLILNLEWST